LSLSSGSKPLDYLPYLWPSIGFHWIDASIAVVVVLTRIESQEDAPEQLWRVLIPNSYDGAKLVDDLIAEAKLKRIGVKS
jgi:hypothetical protein